MAPEGFTLEKELVASVAIANARKANGHAAEVPETPVPKRRKSAPAPVFICEPLPKDMAEALKAPLPPQAIEAHSRVPGLSSIKPMYVIERLNDVFGPGQWKERYEIISTKEVTKMANGIEKTATMIVVKVYLTIPRYGIELEAFGGNDNSDLGDAYKGACTDALTKAASHLGIGQEVYKGLVNGYTQSQPRTQRPPRPQYTPPQVAVLEQKLQQPPQPAPAPAEPELPSKSGEMFKAFEEIREKVGEVAYLTVLNRHGAQRVSQFTKMETAKTAYKELLAIARKGAA